MKKESFIETESTELKRTKTIYNKRMQKDEER